MEFIPGILLMGYAPDMGKAAFALGVAGSLILGLLQGSRITRHDYTGTVISKLAARPDCPTLYVNWDQTLEGVPDGFLKCSCVEPHPQEPAGTAVHPPKDVADSAAPQDVLILNFMEYPSLGGKRLVGESYEIRRGTYRQSFVISPSSAIYSSLAGTSAIPGAAGIVLGILLGLIPKKKVGSV
jgi:hypothetical protein